MIISHKSRLDSTKIENPQVKNAEMKVLISPKEGWDGYVMRIFKLGEGGFTPRHSHDWPHINYIINGKGIVHIDGKDHEIRNGSYAYVPSNALHQFINTGEDELEFICIVPEEGHK